VLKEARLEDTAWVHKVCAELNRVLGEWHARERYLAAALTWHTRRCRAYVNGLLEALTTA
jgi:hypothetical protein